MSEAEAMQQAVWERANVRETRGAEIKTMSTEKTMGKADDVTGHKAARLGRHASIANKLRFMPRMYLLEEEDCCWTVLRMRHPDEKREASLPA
jgi:hypothetical protein